MFVYYIMSDDIKYITDRDIYDEMGIINGKRMLDRIRLNIGFQKR